MVLLAFFVVGTVQYEYCGYLGSTKYSSYKHIFISESITTCNIVD